MAQQRSKDTLFLVDALYCEEESWEEEEHERGTDVEEEEPESQSSSFSLLSEEDLFWEDEDLLSLSSKENEATSKLLQNYLAGDPFLVSARREAVEWMLKVTAHYSFSTLTAVLSVNYLDRFLASLHFQRDKPWMTQLAAVACLSLAAKVEETQVPLLLDLQVEETKYVFEAKTIQRMELLVLSTLNWKMNPVTPLSFIEHIIRRLGLKSHVHWDFFRRCERLLLSVIADSRFVSYLPSVVAAAAMLHVINELEPWNPFEYENQLMAVLKITKDRVGGCLQLIHELTSSGGRKRKHLSNGVILDFVSDSFNDSWPSAAPSSPGPVFKKSRSDHEQLRLASLNRLFVDVISSP
ncbi:cyclin-D3-1-like [Aristolochia californica]|uniref:cyclin-D3-1-like n=1 Tax=Aristolochia californica TaxID=171875 RepID=UPI0035D80C53